MGDRFDLNNDGKNNLEDLFLEMKITNDDDVDNDVEDPDLDEELADSKALWGKTYSSKNSISALHEKIEKCKDTLDDKLQVLQDTYEERSLNEPDFLSSRYDAWQDKQEELSERIDSLRDLILRIEELVDSFDDLVSECSDVLGDCELYAAEYKDLSGVLPTLRSLLG